MVAGLLFYWCGVIVMHCVFRVVIGVVLVMGIVVLGFGFS